MRQHRLRLSAIVSIVTGVLIVGTLSASCGAARTAGSEESATPSSVSSDRAVEILDDIVAGRFSDVHSSFDSAMKSVTAPGDIQQIWEEFQSMRGAYQSHGDATVVDGGFFEIPLKMANGDAVFRVQFNPSGEVARFQVHEK